MNPFTTEEALELILECLQPDHYYYVANEEQKKTLSIAFAQAYESNKDSYISKIVIGKYKGE